MDAFKSVQDGKSQEELMNKMAKGEFTLRDMYNQFQKVMSMGSMGKVRTVPRNSFINALVFVRRSQLFFFYFTLCHKS